MKTPHEEKLPRPTDCLLTSEDVRAKLGGIGSKALRRLVAEGRLPVVKLGKTSPLKFRELDVRRLIEASTFSAPTTGGEGKEPTL